MQSDLSDLEASALDAVDVPALIDLLRELIRIPSVGGSPAESEIQHRLAGILERLGAEVDLWPLDLVAESDAPGFPGAEVERAEAWGLVATTPGAGEDGPTLVLQGHVDVVPPGDLGQWPGRDPWSARLEGGVVYGRGACDMKAGVAANIGVLAALRDAGVRLRGRLAVHCVVGEEDGGLGAFAALRRGHTGDVCVITEPTGGAAVTANGGALTFRIRVPGRATHGSTPYAGVSAVDAFLPIYRALDDLERERNAAPDPIMAQYPVAYPLSVGIVRAGDWASTVPDLLVAEGRLGVAIGEDPAGARQALERCVADAGGRDEWLRDHPATVSWSGGQFASGRLPAGHPLLTTVQGAYADVTGQLPPERGAPYGSDLRLYAGAGIPTLQIGPGDVQVAHSPRECVAVQDVAAACKALALTAIRTCGVA
jgi:acetylornithine deacetylase